MVRSKEKILLPVRERERRVSVVPQKEREREQCDPGELETELRALGRRLSQWGITSGQPRQRIPNCREDELKGISWG